MDCCEQPTKKRRRSPFFIVIAGVIVIAIAVLLKYTNFGTAFIWNASREGTFLLPLVVISAIIDSINPCAFSVLILTISFLMGVQRLRSRIIAIGTVYIGGIFLAYLLIGLGIFQALHIFNTPHFMGKLAAVLLIILGAINLIGMVVPSFPLKLRIPTLAHQRIATFIERASLPAAFVLGGLVGLCEFPCTGGPYLMVLGLLHDTTTYVKGLAYLVLYNLIFIVPLVVILTASSNRVMVETISRWQQQYRKSGRVISGIIMIALGALILFVW